MSGFENNAFLIDSVNDGKRSRNEKNVADVVFKKQETVKKMEQITMTKKNKTKVNQCEYRMQVFNRTRDKRLQ